MMQLQMMSFGRLYILVAFIVLQSCNRQNVSQVTNGNSSSKNASGIIGDTVKSLSESIMVIYQDKKNNYWFGSKGNGVYKYDGKIILNFTTRDNLVDNEIWGIQEDKSGNIYFDTQQGVSKFDGQTFITLQVSKSIDSSWTGIGVDDLWFKGNWNVNSVYRYDGKTFHQHPFPKNKIAEELPRNTPAMTWSPYGIYSIYKDRKGNPWFGTSNAGIYRYNILGNSGKPDWMYEDQLTNIYGGGSFGIRSIFEDKDGSFWFCNTRYRYKVESDDSTSDGMLRYKRENGIDKVKAANENDLIYFLSITEDSTHDLWMVTYDEGVWHYDWSKMSQYLIKDFDKTITLFSIYRDNQGTLWVGSHDHGTYKFNGSAFEKFKL